MDPRPGRELNRRIALTALILVGVGEEQAVVAGEVEVIDTCVHVPTASDDEHGRATGGHCDRSEPSAPRPAHLVALIVRKPWVQKGQSLPAIVQHPSMRNISSADRMCVAGRI